MPERSRKSSYATGAVVLCAGLGLLACSLANAVSRKHADSIELVYWIGIALIAVPIVYRLSRRELSVRERLAMVVLLAMSLYAVKLIRDPMLFTLPDEPIHDFNANQVVGEHELYRQNPILTVTANYPGMAGATSALMTLTGISSYVAGVILIGAAKLTLALGLFVLFARVSGSPRAAGLGVAAYAANSNFLLWGSQYAYESLSLPLFVLVLAALAERHAATARAARAWA